VLEHAGFPRDAPDALGHEEGHEEGPQAVRLRAFSFCDCWL